MILPTLPPDTAKECGRTVRAALPGWPETLRLCLIMTVAAVLVGVLLRALLVLL